MPDLISTDIYIISVIIIIMLISLFLLYVYVYVPPSNFFSYVYVSLPFFSEKPAN